MSKPKKTPNRFDAMREQINSQPSSIEDEKPKRTAFASAYYEKLKHPLWQKRRLEIMAAANWKCENCDAQDDTLAVHHSMYIKGKEPWEYEAYHLHCLCESCHKERQDVEESIKSGMMRLMRHVPTARIRMLVWWMLGKALSETEQEANNA